MDFLVVSPNNKLIACIELKSQAGSFGNNFNNRTEEAIGSAVDIWTAYRNGIFAEQVSPWLGYVMLIEKCEKSTSTLSIREPHFKVMEEFRDTTHLDRYTILCRKLMRERLYTHAALIWTEKPGSKLVSYGVTDNELSFKNFVNRYTAHLAGLQSEFTD